MAQLDQRCFTEDECSSARRNLLTNAGSDPSQSGDGWVKNGETVRACGEYRIENGKETPLGFCLPTGKTVTKAGFGGRKEFEHIGDFIAYAYRYGTVIAGLLAVFMIIAAGFEWLTSGGASDKITAAKTRIGDALMGLFLLALSYILLFTINPALVNLRLPQVWLIRSQQALTGSCADLKEGAKVKQLKEQAKAVTAQELANLHKAAQNAPDVDKKDAACGFDYVSGKGGAQTCAGAFCKPSIGGKQQICMPVSAASILLQTCREGNIAGRIYKSNSIDLDIPFVSEGWEWEWVNEVTLNYVCKNGKFASLGKDGSIFPGDEPSKTQMYLLPVDADKAVKDAQSACGGETALKGFVVAMDFNETNDPDNEMHYLGKEGHTAVDLGDDDVFKKSIPTIADKYFLSGDDLKKGFILNVDVNLVTDID